MRLLIDTLRQVVVVPTAAVQRGPNGTFVYVIKDDNTVTVRSVTLAQQDDVQSVSATACKPASGWSPPASRASPKERRSSAASADDAGQVALADRAAPAEPRRHRAQAKGAGAIQSGAQAAGR